MKNKFSLILVKSVIDSTKMLIGLHYDELFTRIICLLTLPLLNISEYEKHLHIMSEFFKCSIFTQIIAYDAHFFSLINLYIKNLYTSIWTITIGFPFIYQNINFFFCFFTLNWNIICKLKHLFAFFLKRRNKLAKIKKIRFKLKKKNKLFFWVRMSVWFGPLNDND